MVSAIFLASAGLAACAQPGDPGSTSAAQGALGSGGRLDDTYRQIYHPGSGTQF